METQAEVYNLRLVYEWHRWHGTALLPDQMYIDTQQKRDEVIVQIESLPVPSEVLSRLMWEPYLA